MLAKGLELDRSNFTANDSLESTSDLENLFGVLLRHRDSTGRSPVFTPMCIMANPDFEKIEASGFREYHYENFTETCKRYPNRDRVPELWLKGIEARLFVPGYHGREHLSVSRWLNALQTGNTGLLTAFGHRSFGASHFKGEDIPEYLGAFHPDHPAEIADLARIMETGAELFELNCRYKPAHFIAPNRESAKALDATLGKVGVRFLTMNKIRRYPLGDDKYRMEFNWLGRRNSLGQVILTRNGIFEPSSPDRTDWVDSCLEEISIAFKWHKPAVINSHRVNYIGSIHPENAQKGLRELDRLLKEIGKRWPEVEYMTSTELGETIAGQKYSLHADC
jgi:hypothetical protein